MYMLRRFYVLAFFVLGALIAVGLASPFLTQGESAPARGRDGAPAGIYFRSQRQADESLARFDREHPQCQLWTNWQKMCSRTGPNGATHCVGDPAFRARPSRPFCVRPFQARLSPSERQSNDRFCAPGAAGRRANVSDRCGRYRRERPFNGFHVAARRSPLCRHWVNATTRETVCVEGGRGPLGCETAAAARHNVPLACADVSTPRPCEPHREGVIRPPSPGVQLSDLLLFTDWNPVNGLYCR